MMYSIVRNRLPVKYQTIDIVNKFPINSAIFKGVDFELNHCSRACVCVQKRGTDNDNYVDIMCRRLAMTAVRGPTN